MDEAMEEVQWWQWDLQMERVFRFFLRKAEGYVFRIMADPMILAPLAPAVASWLAVQRFTGLLRAVLVAAIAAVWKYVPAPYNVPAVLALGLLPKLGGRAKAVKAYRARLVAFYTEHNPEQLPKVDEILARYQGHEETLFERLLNKYPAAAAPAAAVAAAARAPTSPTAPPLPTTPARGARPANVPTSIDESTPINEAKAAAKLNVEMRLAARLARLKQK
ncbi:hypothetical protein M885DRAFT_623557 [Pelagophyceae sp. CCMP2097]|nr:hypothetical protein M885DRAFT_623557 [Pelagophyceae sp. CCMP2097]